MPDFRVDIDEGEGDVSVQLGAIFREYTLHMTDRSPKRLRKGISIMDGLLAQVGAEKNPLFRANVLFVRSRFLLDLREYDQAIEGFDAAAALGQVSGNRHNDKFTELAVEAYYRRGLARLEEARDFEGARHDANRIIERYNHPVGYYLRGQVRMMNADDANSLESAIEDLSQYVDKYPAQPEGYCQRALAYELQGDTVRARQEIERVITEHPEFPYGYVIRGQIRGDDDIPGTIEDFLIAREKGFYRPDFDEVIENLRQCVDDDNDDDAGDGPREDRY